MKNIFLKIVIPFLSLASIFSCTSYVEDQNIDPDSLLNSDATNLFQGVLLADQFFQTAANGRSAMIWLNQANGENRQYTILNNWNNSVASEFDDNWNFAYVNCITQAKIAQAKADQEVNPNLKGVMQVIEAHCMGTVASLWGDAPYSELDISGNNLTPKYDTQASIYASMQTLLDDAIVNLNSTLGAGIPGDKDIFYAGDNDKWIKLAYSLKARFYLHVKDYTNAKLYANQGISNPEEDMKAKFANSYLQSFNPFYSFLVYDRDDYMSGDGYAARLLDPTTTLYRGNTKTDESARFAFTYLGDANVEYFSPYGLNVYSSDYGNADDYDKSTGKFGSDASVPMATYGEMLLIIAEVDARNDFTSGLNSYNNYRSLLNSGYSIGMGNNGYSLFNYDTEEYDPKTLAYLNYDAIDFAAGGIENATSTTLSEQDALLREIFEERYIYFMGTFECFNDFGRSNNKAEIQLKSGNSGSPQRFLYPQSEINANPNTPNPIPTINTKTPLHL
jgi:hypothetical protein